MTVFNLLQPEKSNDFKNGWLTRLIPSTVELLIFKEEREALGKDTEVTTELDIFKSFNLVYFSILTANVPCPVLPLQNLVLLKSICRTSEKFLSLTNIVSNGIGESLSVSTDDKSSLEKLGSFILDMNLWNLIPPNPSISLIWGVLLIVTCVLKELIGDNLISVGLPSSKKYLVSVVLPMLTTNIAEQLEVTTSLGLIASAPPAENVPLLL